MLRRRESRTHAHGLPDDEDVLIGLARDGNREAYNALVTRHQRSVFNLSYRMMGNAAEAEDVTQDTFLRAWQAIHAFEAGSFRAWLLRIATNRSYDRLRSLSRHPESSLTNNADESDMPVIDEGEDADPVMLIERINLSEALQLALDSLPPDQRLAVILCDVMQHTHDEAASIAGVPVGTIKSRVSRGRERLRNLIRDREEFRELVRDSRRYASGEEARR
ncbi:MAG: RNA polymerase sigma factor [Thermomicrobiales bacterium]